jgi:hypothetical protein
MAQNNRHIDAGVGLENENPHHAVRVLLSPDGKRRAVIFLRLDNSYGFREDAFHNKEVGGYWSTLPSYSTICDTADCAEREARATIGWLIEMNRYPLRGNTRE